MLRKFLVLMVLSIFVDVYSQNYETFFSLKYKEIGADTDYRYRGAGIIVGEPTGLTGTIYLSKHIAIDGVVSWNLREGGFLHLHTDCLLHDFDKFYVEQGELCWYWGAGIFLHLSEESGVGARLPLGVKYFFEDAPFSVFGEVSPNLRVIPGIKVTADIMGGVRYLF